jgi:tetratricopeptide (TPR) repeat protein
MAGAVHRAPLALIMGLVGVGIALLYLGAKLGGRDIRTGSVALLPLAFLVIPAFQSIPIPLGLRAAVDPHGTALIADNALARPAAWPLSLDPPGTRAHIGKAAAALAIFLIAYHLASGRNRRHLLTRAVGLAGVAAVVVGIGHKIFGVAKIYGTLTSTHRTLLIGPFVNANHTAELLELAAFACLACSLQRPTALNRVGWLVGMVLCAGGAAATLSRGAVLAMAVGGLVLALLWRLARDGDNAGPSRKRSWAWGALVVGLVILAGAALSGEQLVDRFRTGVGGDIRFALWRDSLRVVAAHPLGIGRGAFDRVFPVYRTLKTFHPLRFGFVENEPLQLLIDAGWPLFTLVLGAFGFVTWQIVKHGRRDKIEAALVAGLLAVLAHNLVDFGLETPGVLLPFVAILGATLGRMRTAEPKLLLTSRPLLAISCVGLVIGIGSVAHASYDNFDAALKNNPPADVRRDLLVRAQRAHPIDYFYPLSFARLEPVRSPSGGPSPRFRALNRALMLCPACETVHIEVARNLWALGLRGQSLLEWRSAVEIQPKVLPSMLGELFTAGAKPEELASIAASDPERMIEIADFLGSMSRLDAAVIVLDRAEALGVRRDGLWLTRAKLLLQGGRAAAAASVLEQAHAGGVRDPRLALLDAQLRVENQGAEGADQALAILDGAATQNPTDLAVQRMRLDLVTRFAKWQASERALEGFKQALYHNGGSVAEAHVAAARIQSGLGRLTNALGEYRIALADQGGNVGLWLEYGRLAETAGHYPMAREAYGEAARLSPNDPAIRAALKALDERVGRARQEAGGWIRSEGQP